VSPDFFRTLGVSLREGREIAPSDIASVQSVAVINETFGRKILRTDRPIGRRFKYGWSGAWIERPSMIRFYLVFHLGPQDSARAVRRDQSALLYFTTC